jgi:acyl-CoA reductase-like NAD-dependent aldehyde dehydrogenase
MADHLKFYINGEWVNPLGSETIEVINPSDESVIGLYLLELKKILI